MRICTISTAVDPSSPHAYPTTNGVDTLIPNPYKILIRGDTDAYAVSSAWATTSETAAALVTVWGLETEGEAAHVKIYRILRSAGTISTSTSGCSSSYTAGTASAVLFEQELCGVMIDKCNFVTILPIPGEYIVKLFVDDKGTEPLPNHGVTVTWHEIAAVPIPSGYIAGGG
jgi:hypothetical protein